MKICPTCKTQYDDSVNFCRKDGTQLVYQSAESSGAGAQKPILPKKSSLLKKIVIAVVVVVVALIGIYNYMMNAATYLRVEPDQLICPKGGGERMIDVDYDGYIWTINHVPDWVDVVEYENQFNVTINPNATGQVREGSITIQSGDLLAQLMISQACKASYINTSEQEILFKRAGGKQRISVETDGYEWEAQYTNWMKVTKDGDELCIVCPKNTEDYRTGTIKVYEDNVYRTIYIKQAGKCPSCHGSRVVSCMSCGGMGGFGYGMYYTRCFFCNGSGKVSCSPCGGSGYRDE